MYVHYKKSMYINYKEEKECTERYVTCRVENTCCLALYSKTLQTLDPKAIKQGRTFNIPSGMVKRHWSPEEGNATS